MKHLAVVAYPTHTIQYKVGKNKAEKGERQAEETGRKPGSRGTAFQSIALIEAIDDFLQAADFSYYNQIARTWLDYGLFYCKPDVPAKRAFDLFITI